MLNNYHSSLSTVIIAFYVCSCAYLSGSFHFEHRFLTKATIIAFKSFLVYVTADTHFKAIYQTNYFVQYYNKDMIVFT